MQNCIDILIQVYDPKDVVLYAAKDTKNGRFTFVTPYSGTYRTCFTNGSLYLMRILILDKFKVDMFFKYKFGIEAKDYSHLAQLQNLEDVEVQTEWIIDTLYEVQDTVE